MAWVHGHLDGFEYDRGDDMSLATLPEISVRRFRGGLLYFLKGWGVPVWFLAKVFSLNVSYVHQEIKTLPQDIRGRVDELGLEGIRSSFVCSE